MKIYKIILLLITISFLATISSSVEAKDCSHLKILSHKWLTCKGGSDQFDNEIVKGSRKDLKIKSGELEKIEESGEPEKIEESGEPDERTFNEKYKTLFDVFKELKK